MDSAYYGRDAVHAAITGGAHVSVTVRMDQAVKAAIADIDQAAWTTIKYPDAIFDEASGTWISKAEVAEVPYTAFASKKKADRLPGRLVVRRIPDVHAERKKAAGQGTLFDTWRFHAFFTTVPAQELGTVAADQAHRGHAIIEQVHADLKASALAHLPSGKFTANSAWLVLAVIAFNLTRAAAVIASPGPTGRSDLAKATTATVRRKLIHVRPGSRPPPVGSPSTCPTHGPGTRHGSDCSTASPTHPRPFRPDHPADDGATRRTRRGTPRQRGRAITHAPSQSSARGRHHAHCRRLIGGSSLSVRSQFRRSATLSCTRVRSSA